MNRDRKRQRRLEKQVAKARLKRHKRIENGLNLCLIVTCFLAFLTAAVFQIIKDAGNTTK